ncbi:Crp/Fnr family transcriptional regulator [Bacillus sp. HMF5848]|uniref:Crp/Fnr family transcriptional regulator n=1 Tax=Bacillus sp. HMF5848 TaxID=2495421 RepID=UPI000F7B936E|nr:Crp/Fnr family transcriptional regulator [Bacillus sp. HMF5848]RSK29275.1 Crp/Fnr family transcriptional regulator [Bacillus sp. HMF5848]
MAQELKSILGHEANRIELVKGQFLFEEGQPADELFIILSGMIQIGKYTYDGRELTFRVSKKDDIIGEVSLFSTTSKHLVHAKVVETGEALVISKTILEKKLTENPKLALDFMRWMGDSLQKTQTKLRDLVLHGKKGALYSTLIRLSNSYGVQQESDTIINIQLTNQELANFCGTSREVVNRMLSELRKNGILSMAKGVITIHNMQYLRDEINCENCPPDLCNMQ